MRKGITDFWKTSQSHSLTRDPSEPLKRENYWKSVLEVASRVHKTEVFKKGWNLQVVLVCELHHEKTLFFMEERNGTFTMKLSSAALSYLNAHFLKCEHCVCRPPFRSEKFNIVSNDHEHAQKCSFCVSVCKTTFDKPSITEYNSFRDSFPVCKMHKCTTRKNFEISSISIPSHQHWCKRLQGVD